MNYDYGSERQLTSGALKYLDLYAIQEDRRTIYVNFILQIYKSTPILHNDYYSCSLFDKENICDFFILRYTKMEGIPCRGDIISVTKININILGDGEHRLFICEENKLLEKSKEFKINIEKLKSISSKIKFYNINNINTAKKNNIEEIKEKEESLLNSILNGEILNYDYDINNSSNNNNTNNSEKLNKEEINNNIKEKKLEKEGIKKGDFSEQEKDMILESINVFIDDFEDGFKESNQTNKIEEKKEEIKDFSLLAKPSIKKAKEMKIITQAENIKNIQFKYIAEIKQILFEFQNIRLNVKYRIKCRIHLFNIGKNIIYSACSICKKQIRHKEKKCCMGSKEQFLYFFDLIVKDPSGLCKIYFHDKQGKKLMGYSGDYFKKLLEDDNPQNKILFSEYKEAFFNNEYMVTLEFNEDLKSRNKKYEVFDIERIKKNHRYEIVNVLKNILL